LTKIINNLKYILDNNSYYEINNKNFFVLVNTGCYAPMHEGHVYIMNKAREYLISNNNFVLGGYLVPAHTSYVSSKLNKKENYLERLNQC